LLVQRYKNGRFLCSSGIKKSHNLPLPDRQVRLPLPQISGKIYIIDMAKPSNNPAYAIMMEYPVGGHIIFYASPRREPLQKILDKSPKLGTIVKKDFGFDISGIDKFYSVNIKILPEYEQYSCDAGKYFLNYEDASKLATPDEEIMVPDTPPMIFVVDVITVVK